MTQVCTGCKVEKPIESFFRDKRKANGRMPRCSACKAQAYKDWRRRNPDFEKRRYAAQRVETRERHLVRKYGVTLVEYARMLNEQGGCCAICGRPEPSNRGLDVDHDHETGDVRGLLCTSCNRVIGHAHDSEDRLRAAADYLVSKRKGSHDV